MSMVVTVIICLKESVEKMSEPSISRAGGGGGGSGVVVVGAKDNKHKVLLKNKYVAIIFLYICCFCVILFQLVKCCNPKNKK